MPHPVQDFQPRAKHITHAVWFTCCSHIQCSVVCSVSKLYMQATPLPIQLHCQQGTKPSEWSSGYKPFHSLLGLSWYDRACIACKGLSDSPPMSSYLDLSHHPGCRLRWRKITSVCHCSWCLSVAMCAQHVWVWQLSRHIFLRWSSPAKQGGLYMQTDRLVPVCLTPGVRAALLMILHADRQTSSCTVDPRGYDGPSGDCTCIQTGTCTSDPRG